MRYLSLILICTMYISYCYVSYKCCIAIQETWIPSKMCAGETYITDGKHTSLVISVCRIGVCDNLDISDYLDICKISR